MHAVACNRSLTGFYGIHFHGYCCVDQHPTWSANQMTALLEMLRWKVFSFLLTKLTTLGKML